MLGIEVEEARRGDWCDWLAPEVQPFFVDSRRSWPNVSAVDEHTMSEELGHTYRTWRVDRALEILWLDEAAFRELSRAERTALVRAQVEHRRGAVPSVRRWSDLLDPATLRSQADGRRFVWWPSLVAADPDGVLARVVESAPDGAAPDGAPSRHAEVGPTTWQSSSRIVPEARRIAGSFPPSSGPNCFATVMAAAGVAGAEHECTLQEPFLAWLEAACRPGGHDEDPGTVLLWRDTDGAPVHAAITIGDGWALEKGSAEWWTPRAIRTAREVIKASRARGQRLERHRVAA